MSKPYALPVKSYCEMILPALSAAVNLEVSSYLAASPAMRTLCSTAWTPWVFSIPLPVRTRSRATVGRLKFRCRLLAFAADRFQERCSYLCSHWRPARRRRMSFPTSVVERRLPTGVCRRMPFPSILDAQSTLLAFQWAQRSWYPCLSIVSHVGCMGLPLLANTPLAG